MIINDHSETYHDKNDYHFSHAKGYEVLSVKIPSNSVRSDSMPPFVIRAAISYSEY